MKLDDPIVFSIDHYQYLRDRVCAAGRFRSGEVERKQFPDQEHYLRLLDGVDGEDVVLIGGTVSDRATLELYDLGCGIVKHGARSLSLVIPYFGYSTMERAVKRGEIVTAKTRARLFSSIPEASAGNQVLLLDLHAPGIPHYFEGGIRTVHMYAKPVIKAAAHAIGGSNFVLACTDSGRAKWVESLANDMGVDAAFIVKRRLDGRRTEVASVNASVDGRKVIIYDDMIRTGGSLINAARAYKDAGATSISAIATHGVFPEDSVNRLEECELFEHVVATDSHPRAHFYGHDYIEVHSIADVIAAHLMGQQ